MSGSGADSAMSQAEKIQAAQRYVAEKMADIIIKNYDQTGPALETAGTFTALLEAYRACEIALNHLPQGQPSTQKVAGAQSGTSGW